MTWREIYRAFSKEPFGWGPEIVNNLTMYQVRMYLGSDEDMKTFHEPTVPREMFPLQWRLYDSQCSRQLERLKALIVRSMGGC